MAIDKVKTVFRGFSFGIVLAALAAGFSNTGCADAQFDFLLANSYDKERIVLADYYVSEKLDGVRAYWDGRQLHSRGGKVFAAPAWFLAALPGVPLDGELWGGRNTFDRISGIVRRRQAHEGWRQVRFMVFDMPRAAGDFSARLQQLHELEARAGSAFWSVVAHTPAPADDVLLLARLEQVAAAGGEGLMLRRRHSLYRGGRSDDLVKLKSFEDAEAVVMAHHTGKGKYAGQMGSISVRRIDGLVFKIGSGFSDEDRLNPPPIGATISFRFTGLTRSGKPRFPVFLRVRHDEPE